jgi:parallel beta-helix repeat protein
MTVSGNLRIGTTFGAIFAVAVTTLIAIAGDLNPPGGPITPTFKTLTDVEPRTAVNAANTPGDADSLFKITQPGSYYLTGSVRGLAGKHGIEIAASGVTLDLNGFDLVGTAGMGAFDGVSATLGVLTSIAVINGSVRNWGGDGVDLGSVGVSNGRIDGVLASGNAGNGILVGVASQVTNCSVSLNTLSGIAALINCTFINCTASENDGDGISAAASSTVTNCAALSNGGRGLVASSGSTISNCSASHNTSNGISVAGGKVANCSAFSNDADGINAVGDSTVEGCSATSNLGDGIQCSNQCLIRGNTCSDNGEGAGDGAGIHATSNDNRIDGNNCTGADRGIDVDNAGNIIIKNTCSGNTTNWDVVAGNIILVVNAAVAPAVNGNAGGVAPGSTDPDANFSY